MRAHKRGGSLLVVPENWGHWRESIVFPIAYAAVPPFAELANVMREYEPPAEKKLLAGEDYKKTLAELRKKALNAAIAADTKNLGPGYEIGHSYFCPLDGVAAGDAWYRGVVQSEIAPLIQEYWFDDDKKVDEQRAALLA